MRGFWRSGSKASAAENPRDRSLPAPGRLDFFFYGEIRRLADCRIDSVCIATCPVDPQSRAIVREARANTSRHFRLVDHLPNVPGSTPELKLLKEFLFTCAVERVPAAFEFPLSGPFFPFLPLPFQAQILDTNRASRDFHALDESIQTEFELLNTTVGPPLSDTQPFGARYPEYESSGRHEVRFGYPERMLEREGRSDRHMVRLGRAVRTIIGRILKDDGRCLPIERGTGDKHKIENSWRQYSTAYKAGGST